MYLHVRALSSYPSLHYKLRLIGILWIRIFVDLSSGRRFPILHHAYRPPAVPVANDRLLRYKLLPRHRSVRIGIQMNDASSSSRGTPKKDQQQKAAAQRALRAQVARAALPKVRPSRLGLLELPMYAMDHCLVLEAADTSPAGGAIEALPQRRFLPVLLSAQEGLRLEQSLRDGGEPRGRFSLAASLLARKTLFDKIAGTVLPTFDLVAKADGKRTLSQIILDQLDAQGLETRQIILGAAAKGPDTLQMRDMGANTPAAVGSVTIEDLPAYLIVEAIEGRGGSPPSTAKELPLSSAAEAVLLLSELAKRRGDTAASALPPLLVTMELWQEKSTVEEKLPLCFEDTILHW